MFNKEDFNKGLYEFILYTVKHGNESKPDKKGGDEELRRWMDYQNLCLKKMKVGNSTDMTEERKLVLDKVQFPWSSNDERWNKNYQDLVLFHKSNGHCKVPRDAGIGEWVSSQRRGMKQHVQGDKSHLTEERIEKLDLLGFEWNLNDWDAQFRKLASFAEFHGNCSVPHDHGSLGRWVIYQRELYKKLKAGANSSISDDNIEKLESVGFEW